MKFMSVSGSYCTVILWPSCDCFSPHLIYTLLMMQASRQLWSLTDQQALDTMGPFFVLFPVIPGSAQSNSWNERDFYRRDAIYVVQATATDDFGTASVDR